MKLSIITPSYNQSKYLSKNIESILCQSSKDVEHIVVDGGSDDGTIDILKSYDESYNLRWVSEPDRGQTHALNKGLEMANGNWIGWQNSDDFYLPTAFETFRRTLDSNPQADVIYGDLIIVDEQGEKLSQQFMTRPSKFVQRHWSLFASNQSLFVRRSVLEEIFPLDEKLEYTMDAELMWKLLEGNYELIHTAEPLGAFRVQPDAKTYQDVKGIQNKELQKIYGTTRYESIIPEPILQRLAKGVKMVYLLLDRNFKSISYNLSEL